MSIIGSFKYEIKDGVSIFTNIDSKVMTGLVQEGNSGLEFIVNGSYEILDGILYMSGEYIDKNSLREKISITTSSFSIIGKKVNTKQIL